MVRDSNPRSTDRAWYEKESVQAAIAGAMVAGIFGVVIASAQRDSAAASSSNTSPTSAEPRHSSLEFVRRVRENISTQDHHCSEDCDDEPTRTSYKIVLDAPKPAIEGRARRLTNAKLECVAGPCGYSQIIVAPTVSVDALSATASFDVWSKPTSWILSADYFESTG